MIGGKPGAIINIYKRTIFLFVNNVSPDANRPHRQPIWGHIAARPQPAFF